MRFKIAVVTLNQWALDFEGNTKRIINSIVEAETARAIYRFGPELELSGYSVEDGFYDEDTVFHCWKSLHEILKATRDFELVIDVGMPVHFGSLYNCRVVCHKGKVLFIRAKTSLAKEGNYREYRYFKAWPIEAGLVSFRLPTYVTGNEVEYVPFGANFVLDLQDLKGESTLRMGWEICQELWDLKNVSSSLFGDFGCHLVVNSSASYWELRKLDNISAMIQGISMRAGACYAYSNLVGCDGQRYVFSGRSCVYDRGNLVEVMQVNASNLFSEANIIYYEVDPEEINEYRAQQCIQTGNATGDTRLIRSLGNHKNCHELKLTKVTVLHLLVSQADGDYNQHPLDHNHPMILDRTPQSKVDLCDSPLTSIQGMQIKFQEEINHYVSLWLWDYLRRSKMRGFIVPLSGGLDSCCVATIVYCMCTHLHKMIYYGDTFVKEYFKNVHKLSPEDLRTKLETPETICALILKCCYLSTRYSGKATETRARELCKFIGAEFSVVSIDSIFEQCRQLNSTGHIADRQSNLLDQNLQARLRMTMTYYLSEGSRIVLATGNVDEAIMGYLTKYDCSSADINPIGGLCKEDLKSFLEYCCSNLFRSRTELVAVLRSVIEAPPSAELTGPEQRDEDEMGLTYDEISVLGKVRRGVFGCCGPRGAFKRVWLRRDQPPFNTKIRCLQKQDPSRPFDSALELGKIIKRFYQRYIQNRHKLTVLTPALHAETYSPDDNRFDHRQILFPSLAKQFAYIDEMVENIRIHGSLRPYK